MSKTEKPAHRGKRRTPFSTVSLPTPLVEDVQEIVEEFVYWPTKTDFIREAVVEKLEKYKSKLEGSKG